MQHGLVRRLVERRGHMQVGPLQDHVFPGIGDPPPNFESPGPSIPAFVPTARELKADLADPLRSGQLVEHRGCRSVYSDHHTSLLDWDIGPLIEDLVPGLQYL